MSWLDSVAERRFMVGLGLVGLVASGYVLYVARQVWRKAAGQRARNRPKPTEPRYSGAGEICAALGVGALKAVAAREPVDVHAYRCPARSIRARFREEFGGDDARENYPRAVRALLGSQAEVVAPGLRLVEEALRQRVRVGGELWAHALEEYATARGLPFAERETLLSVATQIASAEDRMRLDGILREGDRIPSLLACHWAEGVDLVRAGLRTRWLSEHEGREYLDRAGELAAKWYQDWPTLFGALLLPAYLADDVREAEWGAAIGRQLLTDARSPLRVPLDAAGAAAAPRDVGQ